jgi:hypothetical protein
MSAPFVLLHIYISPRSTALTNTYIKHQPTHLDPVRHARPVLRRRQRDREAHARVVHLPVVVDDGALEALAPEHGELEDGLVPDFFVFWCEGFGFVWVVCR